MIFGDQLILTREGIYVNNNTLETIGIYPNNEVHILPFRTFEYRPEELAYRFPKDFLITSIAPEKWPFVVRFELRLRNRPGALNKAYKFFSKHDINVLFSECTHSGHHHSVLNVLGEVKRLEAIKFSDLIAEIIEWRANRVDLYKEMYERLYKNLGNEAKKIIKSYHEKDCEPEADGWFDMRRPISDEALKKYFTLVMNDKIKKNKHLIDNEEKDEDRGKELQNQKKELELIKRKVLARFKFGEDSDKDETIEPSKKGTYKEWRYSDIKKEVDKDLEGFLNKDNTSNFNKEREENKRTIAKVGRYLAYKYEGEEMSLQNMLEREIAEALPKIRNIEKEFVEKPKDLYKNVESQILPIKLILQAIIMFKRMFVERYKLLIIEDSLDDQKISQKLNDSIKEKANAERNGKNDEVDTEKDDKLDVTPDGVYLYNIRYYDLVIKYPYLSEKALLNSSFEPRDRWLNKLEDIIRRLDKLPPDRIRPGKIESRMDLDPVKITTVESLCHAAYHRAFEDHFRCKAESTMIRFPTPEDFPVHYLDDILRKEKNSSTIAIGSRNTDSFTLRLSPLPISTLKLFREVQFDYQRVCHELCYEQGIKTLSGPIDIYSAHENLCLFGDQKKDEEKKEDTDKDKKKDMNEENLSLEEIIEEIKKERGKKIEEEAKNSIEQEQKKDLLEKIKQILNNKEKKLPEEKLINALQNEITSYFKKHTQAEEKEIKDILDKEIMRRIQVEAEDDFRKSREKKIGKNWDECNGTSMGIGFAFTNSLKKYESKEVSNPHLLNVWRIYNQTFDSSKRHESGCMKATIQALGQHFQGFEENWETAINTIVNHNVSNAFPHAHTLPIDVKLKELSGGKVFVSLPFFHPMRNEWEKCIKRIGEKAGFQKIETVETYTKPVTHEVSEVIKKCHAMIQVLGLAERDPEKKLGELPWLHAEYLTAISLGLKVIRLIDKSTIDEKIIQIGKDHAVDKFSTIEPFSEFEKKVEIAFNRLRKELAEELGLS